MIAPLLFAALALAGNPQPFAPPGEDVEPTLTVASPDDLLEEGRRRFLLGDYEGARIVANQALERPGAHHHDANYLLGMGWEYDGHPARALDIYEALLADWPEGVSTDDVVFRKAEALGRDGRYAEALATLDTLGDPADRDAPARVKLELLRGLWELQSGASLTGLTRIETTLADAAPTDAPWHQAMARAQLIHTTLAQAEAIAFRGSKKKKARQLEARGQLVQIAEEQLVQLIHLDRPVWALEGFGAVARSYHAFGQALLDESKVRIRKRLRPEYEALRRERVIQVWVKAIKRLERGISYGNQLGWTGPPLPLLEADLAALIAEVEAL